MARVAFLIIVIVGCALGADVFVPLQGASELRLLKLPGNRIPFEPNATAGIKNFVNQARTVLASFENGSSNGIALPKRSRRALREIIRIGVDVDKAISIAEKRKLTSLLMEVVAASNNNQRPPAPARLDFIQVPFVLLDHIFCSMAKGSMPSVNLAGSGPDMFGLVDPLPSTFWQKPIKISEHDLSNGFGRKGKFSDIGTIWTYKKAKEGFGGNAGIEVTCNGVDVKVKFGEVHSEPFTSRIFHALGYHVDPTDYSPGLNLHYDRRILLEFNRRRSIKTQFSIFGVVPVYELELQKYHDPFDYIAWAELRDGTKLESSDLKQRLLNFWNTRRPEEDPENYKTEFESEILLLRMREANIQIDDPLVKSIGPWDFEQLGHAQLRELRASGLLAAWLGWCDSRFENTRLKVMSRDGRAQLRHVFSDLGGGLGKNSGILSWRGEQPEQFPWTFTRSWPQRVDEAPHPSFRIINFRPIADNGAYRQMTLGDARWMARLIVQLQDDQIHAALMASGFDVDTSNLYRDKLLNRRDKMILDLGLQEEMPLILPKERASPSID